MTIYVVDTGGTGDYLDLKTCLSSIPALTEDSTVLCRATTGLPDTVPSSRVENKANSYRLTLEFEGTYEIEISTAGNYGTVLEIRDKFVTLDMTNAPASKLIQTDAAHSSPRGIICAYLAADAVVNLINPKLDITTAAGTSTSVRGYQGISIETTSVVNIINPQITGAITTYSSNYAIDALLGTCNIYNASVTDSTKGIRVGALTTIRNCLVQTTGESYNGTPLASSNNVSSDATSWDGANFQNKTVVFSSGQELGSNDTAAYNQGADLSSDPLYAFDFDAQGNPRVGVWDIGALELQIPSAAKDVIVNNPYIYTAPTITTDSNSIFNGQFYSSGSKHYVEFTGVNASKVTYDFDNVETFDLWANDSNDWLTPEAGFSGDVGITLHVWDAATSTVSSTTGKVTVSTIKTPVLSSNVHSFKVIPSTANLSSPSMVPSTTDYAATGTLIDGSPLSVTTSTLDFGVAPVITVYEDFADGLVDLAATIGTWSAVVNPKLSQYKRGASHAINVMDKDTTRRMDKTFDTPITTELFWSQACYIPPKTPWTGGSGWADSGINEAAGEMPEDSTHKFTWFHAEGAEGSLEDSNLCVPSHINTNMVSIGGNSHVLQNGVVRLKNPFLNWFTFESWIKVGTTPSAADGLGSFSYTSPDQGRLTKKWTDGQMFGGANGRTSYIKFHWTGWVDETPHSKSVVATTEGYLSNTCKRFLVSNASVLENSTQVAICPHTTWTANSATLRLKLGTLDPNKDAIYLHYLDENDDSPSSLGLLLNSEVLV